jgi:7,8-dihydropterin-6-yl-methyl-4-(beta-D-ribofuranosyl)aminobenzene 5'-phosphate synthase
MDEITITILCDNINGAQSGFKKDPGFSAAIHSGKKTILFDTGMYNNNLYNNLKAASLKAEDIDAVVLSHNHNDHTNGLPAILHKNPEVPVYIHRKWENGIPFQGMTIQSKNIIIVENPGEQEGLPAGMIVTEPLHSSDYGGIAEHAMIICLKESFVLICGCCHPGLIHFLDRRERLGIDNKMAFHIFGGMHSFSFTENQVDALKSNILSVTLCHCTQHIQRFKNQFSDKCHMGVLGKTYTFS